MTVPHLMRGSAVVLLLALLLCTVATLAYAQTDPWKKAWKQVDSLEKRQQTKSALAKVEEIYTLATAQKNNAQMLKALIYKEKFNLQLNDIEEDAQLLLDFESAILKTDGVVRALLQSMTAELYMTYFNIHSYEFASRTPTADSFDPKDPATWDLARITRRADWLTQQALAAAPLLKQAKVSDFADILIEESKSELYRPTLFDLVAHRAIAFYANDQMRLTLPADQFLAQDPVLLASPAMFAAYQPVTNDTASFLLKALRVYQDLTAFHLAANRTEATVLLALQRLEFIMSKYVADEKLEDYYDDALQNLYNAYKTNPVCAFVAEKITARLSTLAQTYNAKTKANAQHRYKNIAALALIDEVLKAHPKADAAPNLANQRTSILAKTFSVTHEAVLETDATPRLSVVFNNLDKVYTRVYVLSPDEYKSYEDVLDKAYNNYGAFLTFIKARTLVQEKTLNLPLAGDHLAHTTEFALDKLPQGRYIVLSSSSPDFVMDKELTQYSTLQVSNMATVFLTDYYSNKLPSVVVTDRRSGKPLQGVLLKVYLEKYDQKKYDYYWDHVADLTTDANGAVELGNYKGNIRFDAFNQGDALFGTNRYYVYKYNDNEKPKPYNQVIFFTDRAIYRPGQTLYFKGMVLHHKNDTARLNTAYSTMVYLYDANGQKVSQLEVSTNEFGTFQGSFILPNSGITGEFSIGDSNGSQSFRVEEYKRPSFEASIDPLKGTFRVNDKVTITGKATAYSGAALTDAAVKYRIVRQVRYPYWCWWWGPYPAGNDVEMANGTVQTGPDGTYKIDFTALPDPKSDAKNLPVFSYQITVDITDLSGETRSANTTVSVGYVSVLVDANTPEIVWSNDSKISLSATNLDGQPAKAACVVKVYRIDGPNVFLRSRPFGTPDTTTMTEAQFRKLFPQDQWADETDRQKWVNGKEMFSSIINIDTTFSLDLQANSWAEGAYRIVLTGKDSYDTPFEVQREFVVRTPGSKKLPLPDAYYVRAITPTVLPGEKFKLELGTTQPETHYRITLFRGNKKLDEKWVLVKNGIEIYEWPVVEADRGNLSYTVMAVNGSRLYQNTGSVLVPWNNKELQLALTTFRDKLLPGQPETWILQVLGPNGEKVTAEVLAALYDASLNAFTGHHWNRYYWPTRWSGNQTIQGGGFGAVSSQAFPYQTGNYKNSYTQQFTTLNWFALQYYMGNSYYYKDKAYYDSDVLLESSEEQYMSAKPAPAAPAGGMKMDEKASDGMEPMATTANAEVDEDMGGKKDANKTGNDGKTGALQIRTNFAETAFFFPQLKTDEKGNVLLQFTMPEALTRWRLMLYAHTADLKTGYKEVEVVTQKDLMIQLNAPRFFRENDQLTLKARISNLSKGALKGTATLQLFDALTGKPIDGQLGLTVPTVNFDAAAGGNAAVSWSIRIPQGLQAVTWRVVANSGTFSDGEEASLPVLTNRMLVTESLVMEYRGTGTKTYTLDKLKNSGTGSSTLTHQKLTLEFTSNPVWYVVQALPYMMEYPYECVEQTFSRFYANALAAHIVKQNPKIKQVFDQWVNFTPEALLSNLEKNQELKMLMLEETPWVRDAADETEQKKRIALLFDLNRMSNELDKAFNKLQKAQMSNGAFTWFPGMPDDLYMTQVIVSGFGHLIKLGVVDPNKPEVKSMLTRAITYIDDRTRYDYEELKKSPYFKPEDQHIGYVQIMYLYTRSFFLGQPVAQNCQEAHNFWKKQATMFYTQFNWYAQGLIALSLHRLEKGASKVPPLVITALKENSIEKENMGTYWKEGYGYYWYEAPIETQALFIELFAEVAPAEENMLDGMKTWLLKQKQTQNWGTTKATADACYALLMQGDNWLENTEVAQITVGGKPIEPAAIEPGTGYIKTSWGAQEITPAMGTITVTKQEKGVAWGALYWQYFEQMDKVTPAKTPLSLEKQLFVERQSPTGPVMEPLAAGAKLKIGDKIIVRIELRTDRDLEYVHMKDMRAAGFEPINVLSTYKWLGYMGYYESTRDAATNFFFNWLPKGTHVFEYPLRVTHAGDFSNGITSIQCMYAPEFTSHSEGIRVTVQE